jgi:hypothetical protein
MVATRFERSLPLAGVLFGVLLAIALYTTSGEPGDAASVDEVYAYWSDHGGWKMWALDPRAGAGGAAALVVRRRRLPRDPLGRGRSDGVCAPRVRRRDSGCNRLRRNVDPARLSRESGSRQGRGARDRDRGVRTRAAPVVGLAPVDARPDRDARRSRARRPADARVPALAVLGGCRPRDLSLHARGRLRLRRAAPLDGRRRRRPVPTAAGLDCASGRRGGGADATRRSRVDRLGRELRRIARRDVGPRDDLRRHAPSSRPAGLERYKLEAVVGNGFVPGVRIVEQLRDPAHPYGCGSAQGLAFLHEGRQVRLARLAW